MDGGVKQYLGDAVYVDYDGYDLILTTEDGLSTTNRIVLEPNVYRALLDYVTGLASPPPSSSSSSKPDQS